MNRNFLVWPLLLALLGVASAVSRKSPTDVQKLVSISDRLSTAYIQEYRNYKRYGNRTARFERLIDWYSGPIDLKVQDYSELPEPKSDMLCFMCRMLLQLFISERRNGATVEQIGQLAFDQCDILGLQPPEVCLGLVQLNAPVLMHIIDTRPLLTENEVCAVLFQSSQCGVIGDYFEFSVNVNPNRRPVTGPKTASPVSPSAPLKIIHITDIHYDPHYTVGNNAVCGASVCCRHDQGPPASPAEAAGFWGDYRDCDTPPHGVEDVMDRMREAHPDVDYIYHTGDIVDHGIWITSFDLVEDSFNRVHNFFDEKFPTVPLYSVLGNHEAHPTNVFAPSSFFSPPFSMEWLYRLAETKWTRWLPLTTVQSIRRGGYYTALVRPGFRVIGLNNADCFIYNFWILHSPSYLTNQLQWLHNVLLQAEAQGEKVHILGHLASGGSTCFKIWAREYRRIVDRFWDTIVGQFHGHTHNDEFHVFYSLGQPSYPTNAAWNAGSSTAFSHVNPNYHVLTVDRESFEVLDVDSYFYNLTEANLHPTRRPLWRTLYRFKRDHNLPDLSPASLDELAERMAVDKRQISKQWLWSVKMADTAIAEGCAGECLLNTLCKIVTSNLGDTTRCDELTVLFNRGELDAF